MSDKTKPNGSQPHTPDTPITAGVVTLATSVSDITAATRAFETSLEILREQLAHERARAAAERDLFEAALEILREQLAHERTRANAERDLADRTKQHADREHNRADRAQQQLIAAQAELIEARVEAAQLRRKLADPLRPPRRWFRAWRR